MFFKEASCLLNCFGKLLFLQMFGHINFEKIDRIPHFACAEHRVYCG